MTRLLIRLLESLAAKCLVLNTDSSVDVALVPLLELAYRVNFEAALLEVPRGMLTELPARLEVLLGMLQCLPGQLQDTCLLQSEIEMASMDLEYLELMLNTREVHP